MLNLIIYMEKNMSKMFEVLIIKIFFAQSRLCLLKKSLYQLWMLWSYKWQRTNSWNLNHYLIVVFFKILRLKVSKKCKKSSHTPKFTRWYWIAILEFGAPKTPWSFRVKWQNVKVDVLSDRPLFLVQITKLKTLS